MTLPSLRRPSSQSSWRLWFRPFKAIRLLIVFILTLFGLQLSAVSRSQGTTGGSTVRTNSVKKNNKPPKWAYTFLMSDCNPDDPYYRGIYYNVLVSTYILKYYSTGLANDTSTPASKADIVLMIQMSSSTPHERLPAEEEELLNRMKIIFHYLPKPITKPTFYDLVLYKSYVWTLTDYTRILFLDGDVLPLCSLDYLLQLSEDGVFQETVLHAMYEDPVNAGLWIIKPDQEVFDEEIQPLFNRRTALDWDPKIGWNKFLPSTSPATFDEVTVSQYQYRLWDGKIGSGWDFYCADADQGLLLYWSRYLQKQVSIIVGETIEHFEGSSSHYRSTPSSDLAQYSCLGPNNGSRKKTFAANLNSKIATMPFYQDFFHMVGYSKAWELPLSRPLPPLMGEVNSSFEYWHFVLQEVANTFDPSHNVLPKPYQTKEFVGKPKLRGDLFSVVNKGVTLSK